MKTLQRGNDAPGKVHDTAGGLPENCFATLPSDASQIIGIQRGVIGYKPMPHVKPNQLAALNEGLTRAQLEAMEAGSMWGWDVPGADPANYHADGRPMNKAERAARDDALRANGGWAGGPVATNTELPEPQSGCVHNRQSERPDGSKFCQDCGETMAEAPTQEPEDECATEEETMKTCIHLTDLEFPVKLEQRGKNSFRVTYGKQIEDHLRYGEAAAALGASIMHALACAGKLDNRMKGER